MIAWLSRALEWVARLVLINWPVFLMSTPELDRATALLISYLVFQVVGLCYAFLVNAAFALACRVPYFLPPIDLAAVAAISGGINGSTSFNTTTSPAASSSKESLLSSPTRSAQLIAAFYVSYASVRVVVGFAQSVFAIALESAKDFPDAALEMSKGGILLLKLTPIVFVPALTLEMGLMFADTLCLSTTSSPPLLGPALCDGCGLRYLTSAYPEIRRITFYAVVLMAVQLWQCLLHQFPNWTAAFRYLSSTERLVAQVAVLLASVFTVGVAGWFSVVPVAVSNIEALVSCVFFTWTVWLCSFTPVLVRAHGAAWAQRLSQQSLMHLAAFLRFSHVSILAILFCCVCFTTGYLQAQLDITLATIVVPALYSCFYLSAAAAIRAGPALLVRAVPLAGLLSLAITRWADAGGRGGALLVFVHILWKIVQFFADSPGDEPGGWEAEYEYVSAAPAEGASGTEASGSKEGAGAGAVGGAGGGAGAGVGAGAGAVGGGGAITPEAVVAALSRSEGTHTHSHSPPRRDLHGTAGNGNGASHSHSHSHSHSSSHSSSPVRSAIPASCSSPALLHAAAADTTLTHARAAAAGKSASTIARRESFNGISAARIGDPPFALPLDPHGHTGLGSSGFQSRASSDALQMLAERGCEHSSLVSLGLPRELNSHWLVTTSKRNVSFLSHVARKVAVPDSVLTGIIRAFLAVAAIFTLILCTLSVASYTQQNLQLFPRLFEVERRPGGVLHFDHKVVNVTLYPSPRASAPAPAPAPAPVPATASAGDCGGMRYIDPPVPAASTTITATTTTTPPLYAACSWAWHGLSLLDFALVSELAYYDYEGDAERGEHLQGLVTTLFPEEDFVVRPPRPATATTATTAAATATATAAGGDKSASERGVAGPIYLELTSEARDVTVIAIRGTDVGRLMDLMEDIKMFVEPISFTLLSWVFPTIRLWSQDTTSRVIEWLFEFNLFFGLQGEAEYYKPITTHIFNLQAEHGNRSVIVTGHSLGGGLARIVGTLTGLPSVSFSPPGLALSHRKYSAPRPDGTKARISSNGAMHHQSIAVVTEFDWVPAIDKQVGLVQTIVCDRGDKAHQNSCHLLEGTICHLLQHCGDRRHRYDTCAYDVDIAAIAPSLLSFAWTHRYILFPSFLLVLLMVAFAIVPELV